MKDVKIKNWKQFLNENTNFNLIKSFSDYLLLKDIKIENGLIDENMLLFIDNNYIGTIRFYIDCDWVVVDNIEIKEELMGKGIGFHIYESLYKASKDNNMNGLASSLYSKEIAQKRSKFATNVLNKLINKYGGEMLDVSQWITKKSDIDEDIYDYLIDGRGSNNVLKRIV
jgi:hypothetical protein